MCDFVYTAWLRDSSLLIDDQDFEFPACFRISATTEQAALEWGNHIAGLMCDRRPEMSLIRSYVEIADAAKSGVAALPLVAHGVLADDGVIGW